MDFRDALSDVAAPYQELLKASAQVCQESSASFGGDEQVLQLIWQMQAFEGAALVLVDGTPVEVIEPGRWNHADGPDFCDAVLLIGGELRRGNVEIHVRPTDWDQHQHTNDPAYGGIILHVTWFANPPAKTLPKRVPHLALERVLSSYADVQAALQRLEGQHTGRVHPCLNRFQQEPLALDRIVVAAGYHRLLAKTYRFVEQAEAANTAQVFYEGLMTTMGYRRNTEPFKRLAKEVPLKVLEPFSSKTRFAVLARIAGLLKEDQRELWDLWWESGLQPSLQPYHWDFTGLRPQNHPLKRLAGCLGVLHHLPTLLETPLADLPKAISKAAELLRTELGYKTALIGKQRAATVTTNLFVPYRLALGTLPTSQLSVLPSEDISMPMRDTWMRLTGSEDGLPTDGLRQQGLLQIYADFCHNPNLMCETCPLGRGGEPLTSES